MLRPLAQWAWVPTARGEAGTWDNGTKDPRSAAPGPTGRAAACEPGSPAGLPRGPGGPSRPGTCIRGRRARRARPAPRRTSSSRPQQPDSESEWAAHWHLRSWHGTSDGSRRHGGRRGRTFACTLEGTAASETYSTSSNTASEGSCLNDGHSPSLLLAVIENAITSDAWHLALQIACEAGAAFSVPFQAHPAPSKEAQSSAGSSPGP